jgi:glycerol-3-phosphate acyltransferase PlsY
MLIASFLIDVRPWTFGHLGVWIALAASYLLGAVPFGLVLARTLKGVDPRTLGSGNIGAANVGRALGRRWGVATFLLDALKGFTPVFVFAPLAVGGSIGFDQPHEVAWMQLLCGTMAVLGHCYPIYLGFRGGKAVATGAGAMIAVDPVIFLLGGGVWLLVVVITRYVGLASLMMVCSFPFLAWWWMGSDNWEIVLGATLLTILVLVRHRANIVRMLHGTEPRAGEKSRLSKPSGPHG